MYHSHYRTSVYHYYSNLNIYDEKVLLYMFCLQHSIDVLNYKNIT